MDHLIGEFWIRHSNPSRSLTLVLDVDSSAALSGVVILNFFQSFFSTLFIHFWTKFEYWNRINGTVRIAYVGDAGF